jgi:hypothetical protein
MDRPVGGSSIETPLTLQWIVTLRGDPADQMYGSAIDQGKLSGSRSSDESEAGAAMIIERFVGQTTRERAKRQAIVQAIFMTVLLILGIVFQVWLAIPLAALAYVAIAVFYFAVKRDTRSDRPY